MDFSPLKNYYLNYDHENNCIYPNFPLPEELLARQVSLRTVELSIMESTIAYLRANGKMSTESENTLTETYSMLAENISANRVIAYFPHSWLAFEDFKHFRFEYFNQESGIDKICDGFFGNLKNLLNKRFFSEFHTWAFSTVVLAILCLIFIPKLLVTELMMAIAVFTLFEVYSDDIEWPLGKKLFCASCTGLLLVTIFYFVGSDNVKAADMQRYQFVRTLGLGSYGLALLFILAKYLHECCLQLKNKKIEKDFSDYFRANSLKMQLYIYYHVLWWRSLHGDAEFPKRIRLLEQEYDKMNDLYINFTNK